MTESDLLVWGLEHYFSDWEVEAAKDLLDKQGMDAATEYLRKNATESCRGYCGPDQPSYSTGGGKVMLYQSGTPFGEPDYEVDIEKFCRWKLESLYQVKLL